jgi:hypothetical protein
MKTEKLKFSTLAYDDSQEAKDRVFEIMLKAFMKLGHFTGESLGQSDSTYEEAPDILAECAEDGFKFDQKWEGEEE